MAYPSTVEDLERRIAALAADFESTCTREQLPNRTHEGGTGPGPAGRVVHFLRIGTGVGAGRPRVLLAAGAHAREWAPPDALLTFLEKLLTAYSTKGTTKSDMVYAPVTDTRQSPAIPFKEFRIPFADVQRIVEQVELYTIPLVNPDGRAHTMPPKKKKHWRKNRRPAPAGKTCPAVPPGLSDEDLALLDFDDDPAGVDLNRNFDIAWDIDEYYEAAALADVGVSDDECSHLFHGPSAASEPETRNVQKLLVEKDIRFYIDIHSFARRFVFSWGMEQNQSKTPEQTFRNPDFDRSGSKRRDGLGASYAEWMPPGLDREHVALGKRMAAAILASTGFTEAEAKKNAIAAAAHKNSLHEPVQSAVFSGLITGTSRDFAFSRQIGATPGPNVRALAKDPIFSYTFECGHRSDGMFWPAVAIEYPKVEREVAAALAEFLRFAISRRTAPGATTAAPTPPSTPPRPPTRKRLHRTSAHEFQSTGILLAGAGEHDVHVLGALRETDPPLPPAMKEELEPAGDASVYERYFAGELASDQEDPETRPFHPRVPALFVTDRGEPLFLERDWAGIEVALADFPALPDAPPGGPGSAPTPPGPGPTPASTSTAPASPLATTSTTPPTVVPLFRAKPANPLARDTKLQNALDAAINRLERRRGVPVDTLPIPFAIADVTNTAGTFPFAGSRSNEMHYTASLAKIMAMYGAFALRDMAQRYADATGVAPADLVARLVADMNPAIRSVVPEIANAANLQDTHREPGYTRKSPDLTDIDMLAATPKSGGGTTVSFTAEFTTALDGMIVPSHNDDATRCVHGVGYGYLNGALEAGGLFDRAAAPAPGNGLWLAGDFQHEKLWPYVRLASVNDGDVAQIGTAQQLVKLVALIFTRRLVDPATCDEMLVLLENAARGRPRPSGGRFPPENPPFIGRGSAGILRAKSITHNKIGEGPLKRAGIHVASEATVLTGPVAAGRTYVVAWQNLEARAPAMIPVLTTPADVATVFRDTIRDYERP